MTETPSEPRPPSVPSPSRLPSKDTLSAEERLFKAIENGGVPPDKQGGGRFAGFAKILEWLKRSLKKISSLKTWAQVRQGARPRFDLALANRVLMAFMGIGLLVTLANTFFFKPDISRVYNRVAQANVPAGNSPAIAPRPAAQEYLAAVTGRNLFQSGAKVETKSADAVPLTGSDEVLGNLQLVGIAWGAFPEAMIRDKKEGRTHFIKQGQRFKNILVKEILKDRVIVEYGGQPRELM